MILDDKVIVSTHITHAHSAEAEVVRVERQQMIVTMHGQRVVIRCTSNR